MRFPPCPNFALGGWAALTGSRCDGAESDRALGRADAHQAAVDDEGLPGYEARGFARKEHTAFNFLGMSSYFKEYPQAGMPRKAGGVSQLCGGGTYPGAEPGWAGRHSSPRGIRLEAGSSRSYGRRS